MTYISRPGLLLWVYIFAGVIIGCLTPLFLSVTDKPILLIVLPLILIFILLLFKSNRTMFLCIAILPAVTLVPHTVLEINDINISISDMYIIFVLLMMLLNPNYRIDLPKGLYKFIVLFIVFSIASLIWAVDYTKSIAQLVQFIEFMVVGIIIFYNIKTLKEIIQILEIYAAAVVCLIAAVMVVLAINGFSGSPLYIFGYHKNGLGSIVGTAVPLFIGLLMLKKDKRLFYSIALSLNILVLFLTFSRGAMIGAFLGSIALLYLTNKFKNFKIITIGIISMIITILLIPSSYITKITEFGQNSSAYSRVILFQDAISKIVEKPVLGYGLSNYYVKIPAIGFEQDDPNNIFLRTTLELGVIGLLIFLLIVIGFIIMAIKNKKKFTGNKVPLILSAICFSCYFSQFTHNQLDVSWVRGTGLFTYCLLGLLFSLYQRNFSNVEAPPELSPKEE